MDTKVSGLSGMPSKLARFTPPTFRTALHIMCCASMDYHVSGSVFVPGNASTIAGKTSASMSRCPAAAHAAVMPRHSLRHAVGVQPQAAHHDVSRCCPGAILVLQLMPPSTEFKLDELLPSRGKGRLPLQPPRLQSLHEDKTQQQQRPLVWFAFPSMCVNIFLCPTI